MLIVMTAMLVGAVPSTLKTEAASWNGYNYGGGKLYGYQTILEAYGIDYDVYMKWLDDHDADSDNPRYYLGTPYVGQDHRNPHGDCQGAYGAYDTPGYEGMNCTGFVWHVLYKAAVHSGASRSQINRMGVMGGVLSSWSTYGVYRIWFNSLEAAYDSGVLEKGDVMWIYGSSDNHNAIFYGDDPHDWIYWDSAGERNRYCEIHAIGDCQGLWVCKVTKPHKIELQIDTPSGGKGNRFGTKYMIFDSKDKAQAALDHPDSDYYWDQREGTIVLDSDGHGCFRKQSAPSAKELWSGDIPRTNHSYFKSDVKKVDCNTSYYAVQWSHGTGISEDKTIHTFTDSGKRTPSGYRIYKFNAPIHVDTPEFSDMSSTSDGVQLQWNAVKDAYKYRVYYKNRNNDWVRMTETASTSYIDADVRDGATYTYTIRCVDKYGNFISDYDTTGKKHTYHILETPAITSLESTPEGVKLSWDAVENTIDDAPTRYRVYYKSAKYGWRKMTETTDTAYVDADVSKNSTYTYTVRCVDAKGNFVSKYNATGWKHTYQGVNTPQFTEIINELEGVRLKWNAIDNVYAYRVYRRSGNDWLRVAEVKDTEYLDEDLAAGETYLYTIRCVNSAGSFVSDYNADGWSVKYKGIATPQITALTAQNDGVSVTWDAVENAIDYRLYRKTPGGSWTRLAQLSDTAYFDGDITQNTDYLYTVRCVNKRGGFMSDCNYDGWKVSYKGVDTPQIAEIESNADGVRFTWEPVEGAVRYRVYRKTAGQSWTRLAEQTDTAYFDKSAQLGTEYLYTVRCVNEQGGFMSDYNRDGTKATYSGVETPDFTEVENEPEGIRLTWNAIEGVTAYRVYTRGNNGWDRLTETTDTTFFDDKVPFGTTRRYTIRAINDHGDFASDFNEKGWTITYSGVETPQITTLESAENGVSIQWDAVEGAVQYRVFYKGSNGWERLGMTEGTAFVDAAIQEGESRTYTVRCLGSKDNYISDYDHTGSKIEYHPPVDPELTESPQ